jgi:hypothetical protein
MLVENLRDELMRNTIGRPSSGAGRTGQLSRLRPVGGKRSRFTARADASSWTGTAFDTGSMRKTGAILRGLTLCFGLTAFAGFTLAKEMTFTLVRHDYRPRFDLVQDIYADGEIVPGTTERLTKQTRFWGIIPGGVVYFNSPGGSVIEAMKLGDAIRKDGLFTSLGAQAPNEAPPHPGLCASACTLAYLGGEFRFIDEASMFGVHRFFLDGGDLGSDTAQMLSGLVVNYIVRMGADPKLFQLMTIEGKGSILSLPHNVLRDLRVVTDYAKNVIWSLENANDLIYLRAVQETTRGTNKLIFICDPDAELVVIAYFWTGFAAQLVAENSNKIWMVNGRFIDIEKADLPWPPAVRKGIIRLTYHATRCRFALS